jgi:hypothetical protein
VEAVTCAFSACELVVLTVTPTMQTHFRHPGAPARVARQENGWVMSCPVHAVGCTAGVIVPGGR